MSDSQWEHIILDVAGYPCGQFTAAICQTEQDLRASFNFGELGGFHRYAAHIVAERIWPMAVLKRMDINKGQQRKGYGRKGLVEFYDQALSRGAVIAFGRLGSDGDDWGEQNRRFYRNAGWIFLPHGNLEPEFLYRLLP